VTRPAALLLVLAGGLACRPAETRHPLKPEALARFKEARDFAGAGKLDEARASLEAAVSAEPEFTEAWYNLGANLTDLAVREAGRNDDPRPALELFKKGVAAKLLARALMDDGKWFVYGEKERAIMQADLVAALRDVQKATADEETLFLALRMRARDTKAAKP
jgi:tetratricopeptide (TPR) repeat protein